MNKFLDASGITYIFDTYFNPNIINIWSGFDPNSPKKFNFYFKDNQFRGVSILKNNRQHPIYYPTGLIAYDPFIDDAQISYIINGTTYIIDRAQMNSAVELNITSNPTSLNNLFYPNSVAQNDLKYVDLCIDTTKCTSMENMFWKCGNLEEVDLSNINMSKVTKMDGMFALCNNLKKVTFNNSPNNVVTFLNSMFTNCYVLEEIDLDFIDPTNLTTSGLGYMFTGCKKLHTIHWGKFGNLKASGFTLDLSSCPIGYVNGEYMTEEALISWDCLYDMVSTPHTATLTIKLSPITYAHPDIDSFIEYANSNGYTIA